MKNEKLVREKSENVKNEVLRPPCTKNKTLRIYHNNYLLVGILSPFHKRRLWTIFARWLMSRFYKMRQEPFLWEALWAIFTTLIPDQDKMNLVVEWWCSRRTYPKFWEFSGDAKNVPKNQILSFGEKKTCFRDTSVLDKTASFVKFGRRLKI